MVIKTDLPLYPIPVRLYNFGKNNHELDKNLIQDTLDHYNKSKGMVGSNLGGWHSKTGLEDKYESFNLLRKQIEDSANDYCNAYGFQNGLIVGNLWANLNSSGDMNAGHHHATTGLAGVYYPVKSIVDNQCEFNYTDNCTLMPGIWDGKNGGSIYFQDPCYGLKSRLKKIKTPTAYNLSMYHTYPVSGLLILFPSYLVHTVTPFRENIKRISISFTANYERKSPSYNSKEFTT